MHARVGSFISSPSAGPLLAYGAAIKICLPVRGGLYCYTRWMHHIGRTAENLKLKMTISGPARYAQALQSTHAGRGNRQRCIGLNRSLERLKSIERHTALTNVSKPYYHHRNLESRPVWSPAISGMPDDCRHTAVLARHRRQSNGGNAAHHYIKRECAGNAVQCDNWNNPDGGCR
jgi:hypothetical protein